jgi:DNA-binding transcriptional ArsR family regulator
MSSIFPLREKVSLGQREPRLVDLDEETADEVFEALSSRTTREIFLELHRQPQTASDLAEVTDTSVQNVQYHLEKLTDADLVEVVDTWYSERGSEMKVYAPEDESLVLFAGRDKHSTFRKLLNRFVSIFALLVPPSALVGYLANRTSSSDSRVESLAPISQSETYNERDKAVDVTTADGAVEGDAAGNGADDAAPPETETPVAEEQATQTPQETVEETSSTVTDQADSMNETVTQDAFNGTVTPDPTPEFHANLSAEVADGATDTIAGLDPGLAMALAFLLGGLFVFTVFSARSTML